MPDSSTISVHCPCGKRLKAPAGAAGRKAKCPSCGNVMVVEAPPPPPPVLDSDVLEEVPPEPSLDFLSNLDELAAHEAKAAAVAEANDDRIRCPNCLRAMNRGDMLCVNCGYDVRRGKVHNTTTERPKPASAGFLGLGKKSDSSKKDKLAPQGSLMLGIVMSLAFALVASIPWIVVAYASDRDFYILELVVGFAAGLGMQVGQKGYSTTGGLLAAGSTFVMLIVMRILLVVTLLIPMLKAETHAKATEAAKTAQEQEIEDRDPRVAAMLARQDLAAQKIETDEDDEAVDEKSFAKVEAAHKRAEEKLRKMSQPEYLALLPKVEQEEIRLSLIGRQIDPEIRAMGYNPDFQRIEPHKWKEARERVTKRVEALTPQQQKAELKKIDEQMVKDWQDTIARAKAAGKVPAGADDSDSGTSSTFGFVVILLLIFALKPLFFAILAMGAAYRTAAGSVSG